MAAIAHGVGALLFVDMAHIAGLVAAGRPSLAVPPRRHRHDDDPQDAPRTARRADLQPARAPAGGRRGRLPERQGEPQRALAATIDRTVFPGVQGGPLMHVIAGKAVAFQLALGEEFRRDQRRTIENAATLAETPRRPRAAGRLGRHRQPPDARRRDAAGRHRQATPSTSSTRSGSPSTRTRSRSTRSRRTRRPGSASARRRSPRAGMGAGRDARDRPSIIADAIERRDDPAGRAELAGASPRSAARFPVPGAAPARREPSMPGVTFIAAPASSSRSCSSPSSRRRRSRSSSTPLVRRIALRFDAVDQPGHRRVNTSPVPRGGGVAVAAAFVVVTLAVLVLERAVPVRPGPAARSGTRSCSGCCSAAPLAAAFGVVDDYFDLRARWQFLGQLGLALVAIVCGITRRLHREPVRARAHPLRRRRRDRASRSCGSSG